MSLGRYSLGRRLTLSLAVSLAAFFLIQAWMIGNEVTALSERATLSRLAHDQEAILAAFAWPEGGAGGGPKLDWSRIPVIYHRPFSGHYFELRAGGEVIRSRSLWDARLPEPQAAITRDAPGPADQRLLMLARAYDWHGRGIELRVAEDVSAMEAGARAFQRHFLLFAAAAVLALLVLQGWIVQYGLRPLARLREQLGRLERGEIEAVDDAGAPEEIAPLTAEINRLAALIRQRLQRSRHALGDLAHALKTPLAAVAQMLDGEPSEADLRAARARLREMEARIERELARARTAGRTPGGQWPEPAADVRELARMIELAHPGIRMEADAPDAPLPLDREDMLEVLGNLLENAAKWARGWARCEVLRREDGIVILVEDDGPGLEDAQAQAVMARGGRADESKPGHGLGLAIVRDIVDAYDGRIELGKSPPGGLRVEIRLPAP